jgi:hypothetical protein
MRIIDHKQAPSPPALPTSSSALRLSPIVSASRFDSSWNSHSPSSRPDCSLNPRITMFLMDYGECNLLQHRHRRIISCNENRPVEDHVHRKGEVDPGRLPLSQGGSSEHSIAVITAMLEGARFFADLPFATGARRRTIGLATN